MNRPALCSLTLIGALLLPACGEQANPPTSAPAPVADAIYTNARVYTVDAANSWAEAIAVRDGAFIAVGKRADVEALAGPATLRVDLGGRLEVAAHDEDLGRGVAARVRLGRLDAVE